MKASSWRHKKGKDLTHFANRNKKDTKNPFFMKQISLKMGFKIHYTIFFFSYKFRIMIDFYHSKVPFLEALLVQDIFGTDTSLHRSSVLYLLLFVSVSSRSDDVTQSIHKFLCPSIIQEVFKLKKFLQCFKEMSGVFEWRGCFDGRVFRWISKGVSILLRVTDT